MSYHVGINRAMGFKTTWLDVLAPFIAAAGLAAFVLFIVWLDGIDGEPIKRHPNDRQNGKYYMPKPHANASGLRSFWVC